MADSGPMSEEYRKPTKVNFWGPYHSTVHAKWNFSNNHALEGSQILQGVFFKLKKAKTKKNQKKSLVGKMGVWGFLRTLISDFKA